METAFPRCEEPRESGRTVTICLDLRICGARQIEIFSSANACKTPNRDYAQPKTFSDACVHNGAVSERLTVMLERFRQRSYELEHLDKGDYTPEEYEGCIVELQKINEWLGDASALRDSLLKEIAHAGLKSF